MNAIQHCLTRYTVICTILALVLPLSLHSAQETVPVEQPHSEQSIEAFKRSFPRITKQLNNQGLTFGSPLFIRVFKESKELEVWLEAKRGMYELFKTYSICYHSGDLGPKVFEGDQQSPEGFYQISRAQMNPWSNYHLSFNLGYPNDYDQAHLRTGGELMIHGRCSSVGCFAMTDYYMDEIYTLADAALASGQTWFQVHIFPFRLTKENLERYSNRQWYKFWLELEPGYTFFEANRFPPRVLVQGDRYKIIPPVSDSIAGHGIAGDSSEAATIPPAQD